MWIQRKISKAKYLTRCLETRNLSNLLVFFISVFSDELFSAKYMDKIQRNSDKRIIESYILY